MKNMTSKIGLSNVTRHIKNCWLKPDFQFKQRGKQRSVHNYFQQSKPRPPFQLCFADIVEKERMHNMSRPPEGTVHFTTHVNAEEGESSQSNVEHAET